MHILLVWWNPYCLTSQVLHSDVECPLKPSLYLYRA